MNNRNDASPKNYMDLLKEKDQEILYLKRELINVRNSNQNIKPKLSNDIKINDAFLNTNPKSFSTSNKCNSKTIFKFDTKFTNANEKIEVFSDRSPNLKNMNNFNNFNNFNNNINLTNRNSYSSKNFLEIFQNYNNNISNINNNLNNNLSNSTNFTSIKPNARSSSSAIGNQKNFSSTLSNFFRKSNKKNSENYSHSVIRDGIAKCKFYNYYLTKMIYIY